MADTKRPSSARDQEPLVERHPRHTDPTRLDEERTSDNSTVDNGGIARGRNDDPVMPADDATLRTKI
ncbi:MAG TPA: hypothetical protein VEL51_13595 [Vicinamibacterales bacterium]|nr:hypothetical protein [Vicinamibacterales bacterium]